MQKLNYKQSGIKWTIVKQAKHFFSVLIYLDNLVQQENVDYQNRNTLFVPRQNLENSITLKNRQRRDLIDLGPYRNENKDFEFRAVATRLTCPNL